MDARAHSGPRATWTIAKHFSKRASVNTREFQNNKRMWCSVFGRRSSGNSGRPHRMLIRRFNKRSLIQHTSSSRFALSLRRNSDTRFAKAEITSHELRNATLSAEAQSTEIKGQQLAAGKWKALEANNNTSYSSLCQHFSRT